MKHFIPTKLLIGCSLTIFVVACETKSKPKVHIDAESFVPTYTLIVPEQWTTERFGIPIEFAPSIPYSGIEEVRFAPGWADPNSEDYWTYSFLWYLEGKTDFDEKTIEENLEAYYTGLMKRNIVNQKIPKEKVFPAKADFKLVMTSAGDENTFIGTVYMLDYMTQEPITLNAIVHVKNCPGNDNTFVFYQLSPQETTHSIWNSLDKIWMEFQCNSN